MIAEKNRVASLLTSIICFLLIGCASVNIPEKVKADFVEIFQEESLSDYKLLDRRTTNLEFLFKPTKKDFIFSRENEELFINLFLIDKNKLRISLANQYGDTLTREFNGRLEDNTFKFRTKWFMKGNPLVWALGTHDNVMAKNNTGELLLYQSRGGIGFVTLIPIMGTSNGMDVHRFEKIK